MATPETIECIGCDVPILLSSLSAAARNARSGFCTVCKDIDLEKNSPQLNRTYNIRDVPVLGDIDGEVSQILVNSVEQSNEIIALALSQNISLLVLQETRYDLLCRAAANINEGQALRDRSLTPFKPSRRCSNADKCALDIVELFKFVSCITDELPTCLQKSKATVQRQDPLIPAPPSYSTVANHQSSSSPRVSRFIADKIQSLSRSPSSVSCPDSSILQSQSDSSTGQTEQSSPPPPPPPLPSNTPDSFSSPLLMDKTEYMSDESFQLILNKTPGAKSVSLGEATLDLYPNTTVHCPSINMRHPRTPANPSGPSVFFKTPAELRCKKDDPPFTSSPMNINAPPFIPHTQAAFNSSTAASDITDSSNSSLSEDPSGPNTDPGEALIEIQSELRILKAELRTYKQFVDEIRAQNQTPPAHHTNWDEAQEYIRRVNSILEKNPTPSTNDLPRDTNCPNLQPDITPSDSAIHISSPIISAMQSEIEWLIGHVTEQDKHIANLQTEIDNLKQDAARTSSPSPAQNQHAPQSNHEPSPSSSMPQGNHAPAATDSPPQANTTFTRPAHSTDSQNPNVIPNVPTRNRFDILNDEDADIYSPNEVPPPAATPQRPATRPIPRPRQQKPAPQLQQRTSSKKRPKVRTIGSSMVAQQEIHQRARGLDAKCYAHSGENAQQIQPKVIQETSAEDEYIVIAGGTNNVPRDTVINIINHVGDLIDHTRAVRPNAHIIVPQLLHRYNNKYAAKNNSKVDRVNGFLNHKCTKDPKMHFMSLNNIVRDDLYDGLHLDYCGKDKYAEAVAELVFKLEQA